MNRVWITALVCALLIFVTSKAICLAEPPLPDVIWTDPVNLSNTLTSSYFPAIAADAYGNVHVFWAEDVLGNPVKEANTLARGGNAIYYTRWDGTSWSSPVDVVFSAGASMQYPWAIVDKTGILHLVWRSFFGLHYAQAPAALATTAQAWSRDFIVARSRGDTVDLAADQNGTLHLVYANWEDSEYGYKDGNVYYMSSRDNGRTWMEPMKLSEGADEASLTAGSPRIAVDQSGRLHVVWYEAEPPDWLGSRVYYTRSLDGGESWSSPRLVYSRTEEARWASKPNIASVGADEVHIVWVCGELPHRCHQWSSDGGQTWSAPQRVFGALHSLAGWDALTIDGADNLYWVLQLRYPSAMYYSCWEGDSWIDPPRAFVTEGPLVGGHWATMVSVRGNELWLVLQHEVLGEIYYVSGRTPSPYSPPLLVPTPISTPLASPSAAETAVIEEIVIKPTPLTKHMVTPEAVAEVVAVWPILAGAAPVILLIFAVLIGYRRFTGR